MANTSISSLDVSFDEDRILKIFKEQQGHEQVLKDTNYKVRRAKLKKLRNAIVANKAAIYEAVYNDFRKPSAEAESGEVLGVIASINHCIKHLREWMRPKKAETPLPLLGTSSKIYPEPKGLSLIMAPWNYPFQLAIDPLVYAIAAGCPVILKPSEVSNHTSALIAKMLSEIFPQEEVAVIEGDAQVAQFLLKQPFNHIFFTGSSHLGKIVMKAAAEHLSSVTLELGGKSPVIIDETSNIKDAAEKIAWGKFTNCGQTCIAPDYLLVHEKVKDNLVSELKQVIHKFYGQSGNIQDSPDFPRIINDKHFQRVSHLIEDAMQKGARILEGGQRQADEHYIAPTLLEDVNEQMDIMHEEIFGPVLPIISYSTLNKATSYIHSKPKPLALYHFSRSQSHQRFVLKNTSAGGMTINDTLLHITNPDLPFGGVNNSGIGKSHGYHGFLAFSNEKAVVRQKVGWTAIKMIYPPYTKQKEKLIKLMGKLF